MPYVPFASTPGVRSKMQLQPRRDTAPELVLRRELHRRGLRYLVDAAVVPGNRRRRVDVAFRRARVAVFVDGCFWHGCPEHSRRQVEANSWYWGPKMERNRGRDRDTDLRLAAAGWVVVRVWEHQLAEAVGLGMVASHVERVVRERSAVV